MSSLSPKYRSFRKQLQERFKPATQAGDSSPLPTLIAALGVVNQGDNTHLPMLEQLNDSSRTERTKLELGPEEASVLAWIDETFRVLLQDYPLDGNLAAKIQNLRLLVSALALSEDEFHKLGEHSLQQWIDCIYQDCMSWHRGLGRSGEGLLREVERCEAEFSAYFTHHEHEFDKLVADFKSFLETETANAARMQERIVTAELGKLQAAGARHQAGTALNEMMLDHNFTEGVADFLTGPWYDSMQLTLITLGVDSDQWKRILAVTEKVVWSTQPFEASDTDRRQQMYRTIPQIPRELRKLLLSLENDDTEMDLAIALIEDAHFKLLRAPAPRTKPFEPIQLGPTSASTRISTQMKSKVSGLDCGQWFTVKTEEGKTIRAKLVLKLDEYEQLLFVNRSGIKSLQKTFEEFAFLLSSGAARPLRSATAFTESLRLAAGLAADEEIPESEVDDPAALTEPEPRPAQAPELIAAPEPELEPLAEPELETLAEPELEPLAEPELEPLAEPELEPLAEPEPLAKPETSIAAVTDTAMAAATDNVEIVIGSWVRFSDTQSEQLCKLAARIDSIDRLIFVNERGIKQRELNHATVKALLDAGLCEVLEGGAHFQETISQMVHGFHKIDVEEETP